MEATKEQKSLSKSGRTSVNSHAGTGSPKKPSCTSDVPAIHAMTGHERCSNRSQLPEYLAGCRDNFPSPEWKPRRRDRPAPQGRKERSASCQPCWHVALVFLAVWRREQADQVPGTHQRGPLRLCPTPMFAFFERLVVVAGAQHPQIRDSSGATQETGIACPFVAMLCCCSASLSGVRRMVLLSRPRPSREHATNTSFWLNVRSIKHAARVTAAWRPIRTSLCSCKRFTRFVHGHLLLPCYTALLDVNLALYAPFRFEMLRPCMTGRSHGMTG